MEIKGYTLHGDYYLSDKILAHTNWEEACEMKEEIILPNGKTVVAHTLSKEELETISEEERKCDKWYWTSATYGNSNDTAWVVDFGGGFNINYIYCCDNNGGVRLGFKNPF